jgi:hypothetical protein
MKDGEDDEDIPIIDTTTPTTRQGPNTQARARQLNYQVKLFLAVQTSYSPNGVLLKPCDDFVMIRKLGHEPDWWRRDRNVRVCRCLTSKPTKRYPEVVACRWGVTKIRNSKVQGTRKFR